MVEPAAKSAELSVEAHAHLPRHACGFELANEGIDTRALQAYLGHRNIQNTTRYTALAPDRFRGFWKD
jgi:site-specific recombinase XerD